MFLVRRIPDQQGDAVANFASIIGINIYNTTTPVGGSAQSHIVPFQFPNLIHRDHDIYNCSAIDDMNTGFYKVQDLWKVGVLALCVPMLLTKEKQVSKQIISLNNTGNDTTHPGLIGK